MNGHKAEDPLRFHHRQRAKKKRIRESKSDGRGGEAERQEPRGSGHKNRTAA
jgi:hypothetical protein